MRNCKENAGSMDIYNAASYQTFDLITLPAGVATP